MSLIKTFIGDKEYIATPHPGYKVPEDSPWKAFKDGYAELTPVDKSVHCGFIRRTEKKKNSKLRKYIYRAYWWFMFHGPRSWFFHTMRYKGDR